MLSARARQLARGSAPDQSHRMRAPQRRCRSGMLRVPSHRARVDVARRFEFEWSSKARVAHGFEGEPPSDAACRGGSGSRASEQGRVSRAGSISSQALTRPGDCPRVDARSSGIPPWFALAGFARKRHAAALGCMSPSVRQRRPVTCGLVFTRRTDMQCHLRSGFYTQDRHEVSLAPSFSSEHATSCVTLGDSGLGKA